MDDLRVVKCPSCGAPHSLEDAGGRPTFACEHCGATIAVPDAWRTPPPGGAPPQALAPNRPRSRSGLLVFSVFFGVFAFCAAVVVWVVTQPFRDVASKSAAKVAAERAAEAAKPEAAAVFAFGSPGTGQGQFEDVRAIAVDGAGHVYASDYHRTGRIQVFDQAGTFLTQWLVNDRYPVSGMAATRDGVVLVVQQGKITRYDGTSGRALSTVEYAEGFHDVTVLPDGSFVAYGWFMPHDRVVYFDRDGHVTREAKGVVNEQLHEVSLDGQVAADGTGRAWVLAGLTEPTILALSPAGAFTDRIPSGKPRAQQFSGSAEIAVDNAGRLLVTGREGLQLWSAGGQFLEVLPVDGLPRDIAVVDATTAWVSTSNQKLVRVSLPPAR